MDVLYPFNFATPRFFTLHVVNGSEPDLTFTVARIAEENDTNDGTQDA